MGLSLTDVILILIILFFAICMSYVFIEGNKQIPLCEELGGEKTKWYDDCVKEIDGNIYSGRVVEFQGEYKFKPYRN